MELQAIRYAAMVSSMTFEQVVTVYASTMQDEHPLTTAKAELLDFLGWESDEQAINPDVRIILVSAEFSVEITTAVLWLNKKGLDIVCTRIKPYRLGNETLIDVQQIVPLPEAADYEVKLRAQEQEIKRVRANEAAWSGLWYVNVDEGESRSWEDMRRYGFISAGGGARWSAPLKKLKVGDDVYAYQGKHGYVGYGVIAGKPAPVDEFRVNDRPITPEDLKQPGLIHDLENPEMTEWLAPVQWHNTVPLSEAKTFKGIFTHPGSLCKLRHAETIQFLQQQFAKKA